MQPVNVACLWLAVVWDDHLNLIVIKHRKSTLPTLTPPSHPTTE